MKHPERDMSYFVQHGLYIILITSTFIPM
jgi:hypothetical protein